MDNFIDSTLLGYLLLLALVIVVTMNIKTTLPTADNAIVFVNDTAKVFYPAPCMSDQVDRDNLYRLRKTTYFDATQNEMILAADCHLTLTQAGPTWFDIFLQNIHLKALPVSRWTSDGSWKY